MSDSNKETPETEMDRDSYDDDELRALMRQALTPSEPPQGVLAGVQKKLRQRSRGKFYADGWSVGTTPISTYFVTSLLMLVVLTALYLALSPSGWGTP